VDDHVSQHIRQDCEHFIDVSKLSTQQVAQRIYDDGIQILIDMAGYTTYSRPEATTSTDTNQLYWLH